MPETLTINFTVVCERILKGKANDPLFLTPPHGIPARLIVSSQARIYSQTGHMFLLLFEANSSLFESLAKTNGAAITSKYSM